MKQAWIKHKIELFGALKTVVFLGICRSTTSDA